MDGLTEYKDFFVQINYRVNMMGDLVNNFGSYVLLVEVYRFTLYNQKLFALLLSSSFIDSRLPSSAAFCPSAKVRRRLVIFARLLCFPIRTMGDIVIFAIVSASPSSLSVLFPILLLTDFILLTTDVGAVAYLDNVIC